MNWLVKRYLQKTSLDKMGDVFTLLAQRVQKHRAANRGFVPLPIFTACLGIGGMYWCYEVTVEVLDKDDHLIGYALKRRGDVSEQDYRDQYQIVGVAHRATDGFDWGFPVDAMKRVAREIWEDPGKWEEILPRARYAGFEIHYEPERYGVVCGSFEWVMSASLEDVKSFAGTWEVFTDFEDQRIVNHQRKTLAWLGSPNRPTFADLR